MSDVLLDGQMFLVDEELSENRHVEHIFEKRLAGLALVSRARTVPACDVRHQVACFEDPLLALEEFLKAHLLGHCIVDD